MSFLKNNNNNTEDSNNQLKYIITTGNFNS